MKPGDSCMVTDPRGDILIQELQNLVDCGVSKVKNLLERKEF